MEITSRENQVLWYVRLFDGPVLEDASGSCTSRFRSRRVGALLGYLALRLGHPCSRETLSMALWPNEDDEPALANRLRVVLASLRKQLEPPGVPFGGVLDVSIAGCVRLRKEMVRSDVAEFERLYDSGNREAALRMITGTFMPGYTDEWIVLEQDRFDALSDESASSMNSHLQDTIPRITVDSPKSQTSPNMPSRLPLYLTSFFGRVDEKKQLANQICHHRLVTLLGQGGVGKTRLSVEVMRLLEMPGTFVPLEDLTSGDQTADSILRGLNVPVKPGVDSGEQLISELANRGPMLLVLDNAEHIVDSVAVHAQELLGSVQTLRILVTSRERLNLHGESLYPLAPLTLPPQDISPIVLTGQPAVALFFDRARAARPDFALTDRNANEVAEICRRLEGLPLALELAAARVSSQSPAQILASLKTSLLDLKSRQRGLHERHRSLRATISSSIEVLPNNLREFFAVLSVFHGGWNADAAHAVTEGAETEEMLQDLIGRSLIVYSPSQRDVQTRFRFMETVRQFASEELSSTDDALSIRQRHRDYFLCVVESDDEASYSFIDEDVHNIRAAMEFCIEEDDQESGLRLGLALARRWDAKQSHYRETHRMLTRTLEASSRAPIQLRARAAHMAGYAAMKLGESESADRLFSESRALAEESRDWHTVYRCLCCRAYLPVDRQLALSRFDDAVEFARTHDNLNWLVDSLSDSGLNLASAGQTDEGRKRVEEALLLATKAGDERLINYARYKLGPILLMQEELAAAQIHLQKVLKYALGKSDLEAAGFCQVFLSVIFRKQGDYESARLKLIESLKIFSQIEMVYGVFQTLHHTAHLLAAAQSDARTAVTLFGAAEATIDGSVPLATDHLSPANTDSLLAALGESEYADAWDTGKTMTRQEALSRCLQALESNF